MVCCPRTARRLSGEIAVTGKTFPSRSPSASRRSMALGLITGACSSAKPNLGIDASAGGGLGGT